MFCCLCHVCVLIMIPESYILYLLWFNACLSLSVLFLHSKKKDERMEILNQS